MRLIIYSLPVIAALALTTQTVRADERVIQDMTPSEFSGISYSNSSTTPVVAIQEYIPDPFLSFWAPGAPEGVLTMDFNAPLMDDGETRVEIGWGNPRGEGEYYFEKIICRIDGNHLSADLTGKLRTPAIMTPMHPDASYDTMTISVIDVRDQYGEFVASPGQGTTGSYHYLCPYVVINRTNVVAEFSPASGSPIEDVKNVNVWMTGLESCSFEGFDLNVTAKDNSCSTTFIPLSEVKLNPINENECEYDFEIPEDIRENAKRITIRLGGVSTRDGYSHGHEVKCIYGGMAVRNVVPANGESVAVLTEGEVITMRNNLSEIYPDLYVECSISEMNEDSEESVILKATPMERENDGSYFIVNPKELKLYDGHEYVVEFTAWMDKATRFAKPEDTLGTDFVVWEGASAAYRYSEIILGDITPSPDKPLEEGTRIITLNFEGSVRLGNADPSEGELQTYILSDKGARVPFEEIVAVDPLDLDGIILSNRWKLILPEDVMTDPETSLTICFTAYDQDDLVIRGNRGKEKDSWFCITWADGNESMAESLEAEISVTVYNVSGIPVAKGDLREVMNTLTKGLYIINGRKVIVK